MSRTLTDTLERQFQLTWRLAAGHHLPYLTDEACLWEPAGNSWSVHRQPDGRWTHDWAEVEPSPAPTATIGWITWQIIWWWSGLIAASRGEIPAPHDAVNWPGSADGMRRVLHELADEWATMLSGFNDADLERPLAYPWAEPRPFRHAVAWANSELMKNIAEIGNLRRIYENSIGHEGQE